jgi:hypothetical protein
MPIYEYIPVNKQFERSNLSMSSNSPMSKGRVNSMFSSKLMLTPFVFILMIEIGSSPERIKDDTKSSQNRKSGELVNSFTSVLFDVETGLQDHWIKM